MTQQLASSRPASSFARYGIIGATTSPDLSCGHRRPTTRNANAQSASSPGSARTMPEPELSHVPDAEGFLAVAVILQAFSDSGLTGNATASEGDDSSVDLERQHARAFLLSPRGDWATARAAWCLAADLSPEFVRAIARRLEKDPTGERPRTRRQARDVVRMLRPATVARVKERIAYLRDRGVDIVTAKQQEVANVLNAGGFMTSRGHAYNPMNVFELKHLFKRCIDMGEIDG
jgi:hypothetical protein